MNLSNIEKWICKQKISFICSIDNENYPNVKAMLKPRKIIRIKRVLFFYEYFINESGAI